MLTHIPQALSMISCQLLHEKLFLDDDNNLENLPDDYNFTDVDTSKKGATSVGM